jgi:ornithine carbamoyltransferase
MAVPLELETAAAPRHLLGLGELPAEGFGALLAMASVMKRHPLAWRSTLDGRAIACLFEQSSTRSRVSLEVAIHRLGAFPVMLELADVSFAETARELSAYCDAIAIRTPRHRDLLELAEHASVPVVNARTDREHPCRALADCLTLRDRFGDLHGLQVACVGDGEAVANSLIEAAMLCGLVLRIPASHASGPDPALLGRAGAGVRIVETPQEAVSGADAVYAVGHAPDAHELLSLAAPRALFMSAETPEQVANLLPIEQAVLRALVTGDWEL